jgi:hypothetical protein
VIEAANAYLFLRAVNDGKRWGLRRGHLSDLERSPRSRMRLEPRSEPRGEAARLLDGCLRALAVRDAGCRLALGRLIAALRRRRGYQPLGFVRLGDFARERLGISSSECDALARVAEGLASLPLSKAAFLAGEIGFTKARLLVSIATAETEERWLERARNVTTRELEEVIAAESRSAADARDAARAHDALGRVREDDGREIDAEPCARVSVRVPLRVWLLFRRAVRLARRVAGEELPIWKAVEAIAAEGLAAAPDGERALDAEPASSPFPAGRPGGGGGVAEPRAADAFAITPPCSSSVAISADVLRWLGLEWGEVREILVPRAMPLALAADLDGVDPVSLDVRMREIERDRHAIDARVGKLLAIAFDRGIVFELGFASNEEYVRERLGTSIRRARALVALARGLSRSSSIGQAYESGRISWVQATVVLPAVRAGGDSAAWIERASRITLRTLADEVSWALERAALGGEGSRPEIPPLGARLEEVALPPAAEMQMREDGGQVVCDRWIDFRAPESVVGLWSLTIERWRRGREHSWSAAERMLRRVIEEWQALPRHRDPVFERDGWRCAVPGCSSRRNLQDHHVVFRSRNGTNDRSNRTTTCAAHHLNGIHRSWIRVEGKAPDDLVWSLGVVDGSPVARLRGDVYLEGAPWG